MRAGPVVLVLSAAVAGLLDQPVASASERPPGTGGAFVDSLGVPTAFAVDATSDPGLGAAVGVAASPVTCTWAVWNEDDRFFPIYDAEGGSQQHSATGRWLSETCQDRSTAAVTMNIVPEGGTDPEAVARQALETVSIPLPPIETSPRADRGLVVRLPTWVWIAPEWWRPYEATASAWSVSATVEVVPARVTWETGDGGTVTCDGPGRPWAPGLPDEASDCSYTYLSSSSVEPGGRFRLRATVEFDVRWTSSTGATGALGPVTRTAEELVEVGEIQAIETR